MESKQTEKLMNATEGVYMFTTLRTCLDPASDEWAQTTMPGKVEILKKFLAHGNTLQELISEYRAFYIEIKKVDVARQVTDGLTELLSHFLTNEPTNGVVGEG